MNRRKLFSIIIALSLILITIPITVEAAILDYWVTSEVDEDVFWTPHRFDDVDMVYLQGEDMQIWGWYRFEGPNVITWGPHIEEAILSVRTMGPGTTDPDAIMTIYGVPTKKGGAQSIYDDFDQLNGPYTYDYVNVNLSSFVGAGVWHNITVTEIVREIQSAYYFYDGHDIAFVTLSSDDHDSERYVSSEENGYPAKLYVHYKTPDTPPGLPPDVEFEEEYRNYTIWRIPGGGVLEEGEPSIVGTSTNHEAVSFGYQRKGFYAEGLFWAFYFNGTNAGWEFSADGITWTGDFTSIGECAFGYAYSVWFDGTYVHYTRSSDYDLFYRRGTPVNDGTITWSQVEQLADDGSVGNTLMYPCITVDTNGYAWIGAFFDRIDGSNLPVVRKNSENDGTWTTDFAYTLSATSDTKWRVAPIPLTDGKVYVIYCRDSQLPLGKPYDAGWGAEENDLADFAIEKGYLFSAGAIGDNVHFVYDRDVTYQIRHNERVWGVGWDASDVLVQDAVKNYCGPALSADPSTGDLYCFWTHSTPNHVYYKQYTGGAWGGLVDWIDESTDGIQDDFLISSFYMDYSGYIGLIYLTKLGSPYNVKFNFLRLVIDDTFVITDANGTVIPTWNGDNFTDIDDLKDFIDTDIIEYPDPEDPDPPGWEDAEFLTIHRFKLVLFLIGMIMFVGTPVYGFASRPEAATWITIFMCMIVGVALLWSLQTM